MAYSCKDYILSLVNEGYSKRDCSEAYLHYKEFCEKEGISSCSSESYFRRVREVFAGLALEAKVDSTIFDSNDVDLINKSVELTKANLRLADKTRINSKIFRETSRLASNLEHLYTEMIANMSLIPKPKVIKVKAPKNANWAVLGLSDLHFGEEILHELFCNSYNFDIASKRLKLYVEEARKYFQTEKVKKVLIAGLGDFVNSDRRKDESVNNTTNRVKATLLGAYLIQQVIVDLSQDFDLSVAFITGNESRVDLDHEVSKYQATNNFDFLIFEYLRNVFKTSPVKFISPEKVDKEILVNLGGFKLLLAHGESLKTEKDVRDIFYRYSHMGATPDYLIHGHFHSTMITDYSSRSGSLCGSNAYSVKQLNLTGRASQNILIVHKDKSVTSIRIDLQNATNSGYDIVKELEAYDCLGFAKQEKRKNNNGVFEVKF